MKQYKLRTCFWCGAGLKQPPCKMALALNESHEAQAYFSSDLSKERLPRGAQEIPLKPIPKPKKLSWWQRLLKLIMSEVPNSPTPQQNKIK